MGIKKLTVENAQIKTASVEVKTLTISGKQVTLAVFRQLPERSVIAWNREHPTGLRGKAWGRVNYHPDKCADDKADHIHVVWQDETVLYRAYVHLDYLEAIAGRQPGKYYLKRNSQSEPYALYINQPYGMTHNPTPYEHSEESAEAYFNLISELEDLDQLFIAV
jgi:hypothetical protein